MNKAALVTGGATRLGRHLALALAHNGYDIALHFSRSAEQAQRVHEDITRLGRQCRLIQCDFSQQDTAAVVTEAVTAFPGLSLLVNSASAYTPAPIMDTDPGMLEEQFRINLFAPFMLIRHFAGAVPAGDIVNIIDNKISMHQYPYAAYLLSKKSLSDLTLMAALELAPRFRVNGIAPGVTLPAASRTPDYIQWRLEGIPLRQQGTPDYIGKALLYLLGNPFVTGQILFVDGGEAVNHTGRHSENYRT